MINKRIDEEDDEFLKMIEEEEINHRVLLAQRVELAIGRAGLGQANSGLGQNRAGPKLAWFCLAKILVAQPALKTGLVGPNSFLKAKKFRAGRAGSGHTGPGHIGQGQI